MCPTTGDKNKQQSKMLSNPLTINNRNMNNFSENIDQNGLVFSDENTFNQNNISNHMSNHYERDSSQAGVTKPSKFLMNSNVNDFHQVNVINQVRSHFC